MNHNDIYNLALQKYNEHQYDESIKLLDTILQEDPDFYHAWHLLGNIFFQLEELNSAKDFFLAAINKKSDFFDGYYMLGNVLFKAQLYEEAINIWMDATVYNPYFALTFANIGITYDKINNKEKAIFYSQKALSLDQNCTEALFCLAKIYQAQLDVPLTQHYLKKVIALQPHNVLANFDLAYVQLALENYEEGFSYFEYRKKMIHREKEYNYLPFTPYSGENIENKRVLLYHEQGFGDNIQFIRFVNNLICQEICIAIQNPLNRLFAYNFPHIQFLNNVSSADTFDCMDALMSVAYISKIKTISCKPYLKVDNKDVKIFKKKYLKKDSLNIGLVWKGSIPKSGLDVKSIQLDVLKDILNIANCTFYSLQIEHFEEINTTNIRNIGEEFSDFYDTAVALKSLDCYIGVDTAVSHLAGALGVQSYLIYNTNTIDFRWANKHRKSIWYESVEVFSHNEIALIAKQIEQLVKDTLQ